jgi:hypothetical protein
MVGGMALLLPQAVVAGKLGVIGDSLSLATDADDQCSDAFECLENFGEDSRYSFSAGIQPWSLGPRLGATDVVSAAADGAEWADALEQAQSVMATPGVTDVVVALGGNDVCGVKSATDDPYAAIAQHVDATLAFLTARLPTGGSVTLVEAPDVSRLRQVGAALPNFAFESCQALWDRRRDGLKRSAVREACEGAFGSFICRSSLLIDAAQNRITDSTNSVCEPVLKSSSPPSLRARAALVNRQVNNIIRQRLLRYRGRNGVAVRLADIYQRWQFEGADISYLDCFHPNRGGQSRLAEVVWRRKFAPSRMLQSAGVFDGSFLLLPPGGQSGSAVFVPPRDSGGARALAGDWDGDGYAGVGLYYSATGHFELYDDASAGVAGPTRVFRYGPRGAGWMAVSGDWDGDGRDGIGLYDPAKGVFHLRERAGGGPADRIVRFGPVRPRVQPVAGDWNGDGRDGIGVYEPATGRFRLRDVAAAGAAADRILRYGPISSALRPVVGDWRGDGAFGVGLYDTARRVFMLRWSATPGVADQVIAVPGAASDAQPVAGRWVNG